MAYALSLDIGATSIGHAAFRIDEGGNRVKLLHIGTRIFPTGREGDKISAHLLLPTDVSNGK